MTGVEYVGKIDTDQTFTTTNIIRPEFKTSARFLKPSDQSTESVKSFCVERIMEAARNLFQSVKSFQYHKIDDYQVLCEYDDEGIVLNYLDRMQKALEKQNIDDTRFFDALRIIHIVEQRMRRLEIFLDQPHSGICSNNDFRIDYEDAVLDRIDNPCFALYMERALWATDDAIAYLVEHSPLIPVRRAENHISPI